MKLAFSLLGFLLFWSAHADASYITNDGTRCYRGERTCSTEISWDSGYRNAFITVESRQEGRSEKLFACGSHGYQLANWIRTNDRYVFRLYEGECPRSRFPSQWELRYLLDTTVVQVNNNRGRHDDRGRQGRRGRHGRH